MKNLITNTNQTMSTKEISELIKHIPGAKEKRHSNVMRDVRVQLEAQNIDGTIFESVYLGRNNEQRPCYELDYDQTMILISGYSIPIRSAVVKRWHQLENKNNGIPKTLPDALRAYARALEDKEQAEARVDRLIHNKRTYTTTEIAKELGYRSAKAFNKVLHEKGIIYKSSKKTWLLYAEHSDKNYAEIRQKEVLNPEKEKPFIVYSLQWTGKGRDWLIEMFDKPFELEAV